MSKRVLVIDDDPAVRRAFELALKGLELDIELADSGEAGMAAFEAAPPDLIYLDLRMPGMNGVEVLRAVRERGFEGPVIIVTAFHREFFDDLVAARRDGVEFDVLQKPVERDQIIKVTRAILEGDVIVSE
jgi:DNA-binding NtrC family response regulator